MPACPTTQPSLVVRFIKKHELGKPAIHVHNLPQGRLSSAVARARSKRRVAPPLMCAAHVALECDHGGNALVFMPICPACFYVCVQRRFFFRPHVGEENDGDELNTYPPTPMWAKKN